jgi:hypothetical protein
MRPIQLTYVLATCILAIAHLSARADDAPKTEGTPQATAPAQAGTLTVTSGPVQAQEQGQITVTAAQAVPGAGPMAGSISVDANGVKQVQNEEYGKKISITDDPQKGIKIEHTFKKGGSDETKTYRAKDVKDLEKKFPEGFKLYQQYLGNQAGAGTIVVQGIIQGPGMIMPAVPGQPAPFPMPGGGAGGIQLGQAQLVVGPGGGALPIEMATEALGQLRKDIKSAAASGTWKDASLESRVALKKQAAAMRKQLQDLENQLEGK